MNVWVTDRGLSFDYFRNVSEGKETGRKGHVVSMELVGGRPTKDVVGVNPSTFRYGYQTKAQSKPVMAQTFGETRTEDLIPGVDLRTYTEGSKPRYDLIVAPGTSPDSVKLKFKGAPVTATTSALDFKTSVGEFKHTGLFAYQVVGGARKAVSVSFVAKGTDTVGFKVGAYDTSKPLIIDPLVYGSYYGGDNGFDEVRSVVGDSGGGVYLVGSTQATQFPVIQGPYFLNLLGGKDAFVAKLQGDAYRHDYCVFIGGTEAEVAQYAKLDPFGNLWVAGTTFSTDFPGNTRRNVQFLSQISGLPATGGTFRLRHGAVLTDPIPFDATPDDVKEALDAALGGNAIVTSMNGQDLPGGRYRISLDNNLPLRLAVVNVRTLDGGTFVETNEGLPSIIAAYPEGPGGATLYESQELRHRGSRPLFIPQAPIDALFQLGITINGNLFGTPVLRQDATAAQVQAAIAAVVGAGNVTVTGTGPLSENNFTIVFGGTFNVAQPKIQVFNQASPNPAYGIFKPSDIFVTRFARSGTILDPTNPQVTNIIGGEDENEFLGGFEVVPQLNAQPGDPVRLLVFGETSGTNPIVDLAGAPNNTGTTGFLMRHVWDGTSFNLNAAASRYIQADGPGASLSTTGLATDSTGAAYLTGTVTFAGTVDNRGANPVFQVTPGIFNEGWFLRNTDIYVRKYLEDGSLKYSGLIGGNNADISGGTYIDITGERVSIGSSIAVDRQGNAYITGRTTSFNYPRTRGVFGESFDNNPNVVVTKISASADKILYSTNLRTRGSVFPGGVGVDSRGNAYVVGMITRNALSFPNPPGDPNEPNGMSGFSIQLTPDALDNAYDTPAPPELPTTEGFINVLSPDARTLVYGSFIGGNLDECVFGPFIDSFGDVWVCGWSDTTRLYFRVSSTGNVTVRQSAGSLPGNYISPLAFKSQGDATGQTGITVNYGNLQVPAAGPTTIASNYWRDGFLFKQRINLPILNTLTLNPTTIPGGLGATSIGTVTLTQAAPVGGAQVEVLLSSTEAASLNAAADVASLKFTIPQGQTTGNFTIFSKGVLIPTGVDVKASYLNTFKIQRLTVVPWLDTNSVTPESVVGGNITTGRVNLINPAPAGGVRVDLTTDRPDLVSFPDNQGNNTVVVPAGATSATYTIATSGVATSTPVQVNAQLLGVTKSASVLLTVASLDRLEFVPNIVASLNRTTGTIYLDGQAGSEFTVDLEMLGGLPEGYSFVGPRVVDGSKVVFQSGERQVSFDVQTPYEAADVTRIVRATRAAQGDYPLSTAQGSFQVRSIALLTFTIDPETLNGGESTTGNVTISSAAPAGGVTLNLAATVNGDVVTLPGATITVPQGQTTVNFTIPTRVVVLDTDVTLEVSRGPVAISRVLKVKGLTGTLVITPGSVIGGAANATGVFTLSQNAPAGGVTVDLASSDPGAANVPASIFIAAGTNSASFTVTSQEVPDTVSVTISSSIGGTAQGTGSLQVRRRGIASITFSPSTVRSLRGTVVTITLDAPSKEGGTLVTLSATNPQLLNLPESIRIPAGQTTYSFGVVTRRVSRNLSTTVTASLDNGSAASGVVTVIR
ncbi:MAG: SBBP repeat-containing protein [Fimbriimonas sp.]